MNAVAAFLSAHALTVVSTFASVAMALHLLSTRRTPQSLFAWLLGAIFFPVAAVPLYLAFGARKLPVRGKAPALLPVANEEPADVRMPVERVLRSTGVSPAFPGHRLEVLPNGEDAYARLIALLRSAQKTIDLTVFIFGNDPVGDTIVDVLVERAQAGVEVRVLLDAVGSFWALRRAQRRLTAAGAQFRVFLPLLRIPGRGLSNLRSHRKLVIVDGAKVFLGGMNLTEKYLGPKPKQGRWHDFGAVVEGPVARDAEAIFADDWAFSDGAPRELSPRPLPFEGGATVQLVPSGPDMLADTFADALVTALFAARERVLLVTPYYVPDDLVQRAFLLAARRGVSVDVIVPEESDHVYADYARAGLLRELRAGGVAVWLHPEMVHAKGMVVDDRFAYVGSANVDMRSLYLNYEDTLAIYDAPHVAVVEAALLELRNASRLDDGKPGRHWPFLEQLARLLAPQL